MLSRSIPSPEQRNGILTDSGEESGRQAVDDDQRPVVSVVCPVIPDEAVTGERTIPPPLNLALGSGVIGGPVSPPPPLPPRRFSRETKPIPDDADQSLPIATGMCGDSAFLLDRCFRENLYSSRSVTFDFLIL